METDSRGRGEGSVGDDAAASAEDHLWHLNEEPCQSNSAVEDRVFRDKQSEGSQWSGSLCTEEQITE